MPRSTAPPSMPLSRQSTEDSRSRRASHQGTPPSVLSRSASAATGVINVRNQSSLESLLEYSYAQEGENEFLLSSRSEVPPHAEAAFEKDDIGVDSGVDADSAGDDSPFSEPPSYVTSVSHVDLGPPLCIGGRDDSEEARAKAASTRWWHLRRPRFTMPRADYVVVLLALFFTEASRGIVIPTMFDYVRLSGGTESTYGTLISLFSVGRLVCSVPFGEWADRRGSSREVLIFASLLAAASNLLYSFAYALPNPVWWLYGTRTACGFSTGTIAVFRAYLASAVPPEERTKAIAWSGMAQYAGFSLTPILATIVMYIRDAVTASDGAFTGLSTPSDGALSAFSSPPNMTLELPGDEEEPAHTDIISLMLPTVLLTVINMIMVPVLIWFMPKKDPIAPVPAVVLPSPTTSAATAMSAETRLIHFGFILFFILNLVLRGVIGVTETLAIEMYEHYRTDIPNAVEESGKFFFVLGLAGLVVFLLVDPIQKRILSGPNLLILGIVAVVAGTAVNTDPRPARTTFNWVGFVSGMTLIWSIGSPICQTLTVSMFSKMLGARPQGSLIGWITTAGSLGRIIFPALVSISRGAAIAVNWTDVVLCLGCAAGVVAFERYVRIVRKRQSLLLGEGEQERGDLGIGTSAEVPLLADDDMDGDTDTNDSP
ncbi:hypothetical protein HKX48_003505 [Thoreauomyces humboldtii]|nr:hypothetical protein HKX48_003505 [Thoreauomyces humboldtii]